MNKEKHGDYPSYNPDTVGTAVPTKESVPKPLNITYGMAIEHMRKGGMIARRGWNGTGMYVFKQVPSKVPAHVVPNMSSLPESVKKCMITVGVSPDYQNQMAINLYIQQCLVHMGFL